jgi:hypothetical protein
MDVVVVVAYGVIAAAAVAGGIVLARLVWRRLAPPARVQVRRSAVDRRRRSTPVAWERRLRARRLEDVAKGFLEGFNGGAGAGVR